MPSATLIIIIIIIIITITIKQFKKRVIISGMQL